MYRITLLLSALTGGAIDAKRHSHTQKVERYEKRAQQVADAYSPLAAALAKQTKHMTYDEALSAQEYYRKEQEPDMVMKTGERLLAVGGNQTIPGVQEVLRKTRLELARLCLEQRKFADAQRHAEDYLIFYPGSQESKQASFIALTAAYRSQLHAHRDQQKTRETVAQANAFLEKFPQDTEFAAQVQEMLHQSYQKLIRSELNIIETQYHMSQHASSPESLIAADKRLNELKETLLPLAPHTRKRVLEMELLIAQAHHNHERIEHIRHELSTIPQQPTAAPTMWRSVKTYFFEDTAAYFA
jgi:outer membrane protein assembly factor BamD (BamD/ComL family)